MYRPLLLRYSTCCLVFLFFIVGCVSRDEPRPSDCDNSDLAITIAAQTNPAGCAANDGQIRVAATGGLAPYQFSIDNGAYAAVAEFTSLGAGVFTVHVKDANGCEQNTEVTLAVSGATLTASVSILNDNQCLTDNGSINVTASGGFPPYQYRVGSGAFGSNALFNNLKNGSYVITVKDDSGCSLSLSTVVERSNTGISYSSEVKAIITAKCATSSCHAGNQSPNLTVFSNLTASSQRMKVRIENGSMPPVSNTALTVEEKSKIICWIEDGTNNN